MDFIQTLIFAIIQGITEWLPISSSGHLAIVQRYFKISDSAQVFLNIALHVGTMLVVIVTFRKDILDILKAFFKGNFNSEEGKLAIFIIVGSIPTAIIGFLLLYSDIINAIFSNMLIVGTGFLITGIFLYASKYTKNGKQLGLLDSLFIGVAQGIATLPGISRSGFTISTGLIRKVKREKVFKYSFLLSIPAVLGAMAATVIKERASIVAGNLDLSLMIFGAIVSFIIGYLSLQFLQRIFMKQKFHLFAFYCWAIGLLAIFLYFL